ncbi:MAG: hypothetical protein U0132_21610 [Gemmatimonadaceae bacterium]
MGGELRLNKGQAWKFTLRLEHAVSIHDHPPSITDRSAIVEVHRRHGKSSARFDGVQMK